MSSRAYQGEIMSKQINIRVSDEIRNEIENVLKDGKSINKFIAEAIELAVTVEKNMDKKAHSRLVIENAKGQPQDYKLLLKTI